eukprot:jgi/Mesvir1/3376/Mv15835-RA.1
MVNIPDEKHGTPWIQRVLEPRRGQADLLLVIYSEGEKQCGLSWDTGPGKLYCVRIPSRTFTKGRNIIARVAHRIEAERGAAYNYWVVADWDTSLGFSSPELMPPGVDPYEAFESALIALQSPVVVPVINIAQLKFKAIYGAARTRHLACSEVPQRHSTVASKKRLSFVRASITPGGNATDSGARGSLAPLTRSRPPLLTCQHDATAVVSGMGAQSSKQGAPQVRGASLTGNGCRLKGEGPRSQGTNKTRLSAQVRLTCHTPVLMKPNEMLVYVPIVTGPGGHYDGPGRDLPDADSTENATAGAQLRNRTPSQEGSPLPSLVGGMQPPQPGPLGNASGQALGSGVPKQGAATQGNAPKQENNVGGWGVPQQDATLGGAPGKQAPGGGAINKDAGGGVLQPDPGGGAHNQDTGGIVVNGGVPSGTSSGVSRDSFPDPSPAEGGVAPLGVPLRLISARKVDFCFMALHRSAVPMLLPLHNLDNITWWGSNECWWAGLACFDYTTLVLRDISVTNTVHSKNYRSGFLSYADLVHVVRERYRGIIEAGVLNVHDVFTEGKVPGEDYRPRPNLDIAMVDGGWQAAKHFLTCERIMGPEFDAFVSNGTCDWMC